MEMKSHFCRFQIGADLCVQDCNPSAHILVAIVDTPIETYLLQLFDDAAIAEMRQWLQQAQISERPCAMHRLLATRPNPTFGRDANLLPVDLDIESDDTIWLQFDVNYLACTAKSFWMIGTRLSALLNLNAMICNASGTVVAAHFSDYGSLLNQSSIRLHDCFDHATCDRIIELLRNPDQALIWHLSDVMFTPRSNTAFAGELLLFPLRVADALKKVLIIFRENSLGKAELNGGSISITSFIAAIENAIESIAIFDSERRFLYINRSFCETFNGNNPQEFIGRDWSTVYGPDTQRLIEQEVLPAVHRDGAWQGTLTVTRRDGTAFHQMSSAKLVPGVGYIGTGLDITAWKRTADALQTSEMQLGAVVGTARDAILTIDDAGMLLHWNKSAEQLFGYSREIMLGQNIERLLPRDERAAARRSLLAAAAGEARPQTIEMTLFNATGDSIVVEASLSDWYCTQGRHYRTLIMRDIRERLHHLEQVVEASDQLARVQTQRVVYSEIIEFATSIIAVDIDRISDVLEKFSRAAQLRRCALYRVFDGAEPVLEHIGDLSDERQPGAPEVMLIITAAELDEIRRQRRQPYPPLADTGLLRALRHNRSHLAFFDTLAALGNNASYVLWCEIDRADLDERTILMLELSALKLSACLESHARIEAAARRTALENIGQVAASLAHENNHFASIISSNLHMLRRELLSGNQHELIDDMQIALKNHQTMFNRLLGAARMDSYVNELINPDEIIARSIKLLSSSLPGSIALKVERHGNFCTLDVDAAMFGSALFNILINAYQACGAHGDITISTQRIGAWLDIQVRDNGCGIAPEVLRRVTDPFYSTKRGRRGTGLGLFMVKNFCTQAGGKLLIESEPGKGTAVTLRLPIIDDTDLRMQVPLPLH